MNPPPVPACAERPRPGRAACPMTSTPPRRALYGIGWGVPSVRQLLPRPGVRGLATAGAWFLSSALPPAPACADRPQPGHLAYLVSSVPHRRARPSHDRGERAVTNPPPAPACAWRPRLGSAACPMTSTPPRRALYGIGWGVPTVK